MGARQVALLLLLPLAAGASVSLAAAAAGPGPLPVHIEMQAPPGCSGVDAFFERIRARTDRVHLALEGEGGVRLRVRLTRLGAKLSGELRLTDEKGETDARKVEGATCEEIVEALSLTAALAINPAARLSAAPAPQSSAAPAPPSGTASAVATGAPAASASPPSPAPTATPAATAASPPAPAAVPTVSTGATGAASTSTSSQSAGLTIDLGAHAVVTEVVSPYASVGGSIFVRVTRATGTAFSPSVGLALIYAPNDSLQTPDVSVKWTAVALSICPVRLALGATSRIEPCALGIGGLLTATAMAVSNPDSASRSWWSAGGLVRASTDLGGGLALELQGGVTAPLLVRHFVTIMPETKVGETPPLSALGSLGLAYEF